MIKRARAISAEAGPYAGRHGSRLLKGQQVDPLVTQRVAAMLDRHSQLFQVMEDMHVARMFDIVKLAGTVGIAADNTFDGNGAHQFTRDCLK